VYEVDVGSVILATWLKLVDPVPAFISNVNPVIGEPPSFGITQSIVIDVEEAEFLVGAAGVTGTVAEMIETAEVCGPSPTTFNAVTLY